MAEFTKKFNVEERKQTSDWATYRRFIEDLRVELREGRYSHGVPVLPPQVNPPTRWFDIVLQTSDRSIKLRIRRDNLYLEAFQRGDSEQWLELRSSPPHLIPGSTLLGFGGSYDHLEGAAGARMDTIPLGQQQLVNAVNQLATPTTSHQDTARYLIVVIQMISESVRFVRISNHLADWSSHGNAPPAWMLDMEHGWGDLSAELLRADADPEGRFRLAQPNAMGIVTVAQAAAVLGIVLRAYIQPRRYQRRLLSEGEGRPLVEVFSVRINDIDGENPGDLYGTIRVTDGLDSYYIYNRSRDKYESIRPGEYASLTGPARSFSAYGSFTIYVDLMDRDDDLSPDDEVSKGKISWNVFDTTNRYDEPLSNMVTGKYGSATVTYIVLSDAVEATVEVTLINGDGEDPADVYGLITATNLNFTDFESVLFRKSREEYIEVSPGRRIPLSRSVVAVPLNSILRVGANLTDRDGDPSPDDEIANGKAEFYAQLSGTSVDSIYGKCGEIQVKVTWTVHI